MSPTGTNISLWDGWGQSNHGFGEFESAPVWVTGAGNRELILAGQGELFGRE